MELRDLRYFAVVAEHLNIGRASEALDLSATALGKSLRRLERSIGAKLVQRTSKGVALTSVGSALLARVRPLQGMVNDVRHEAADLARGYAGHVAMGVPRGAQESFVGQACAALVNTTAPVTISIATGTNQELSARLCNGELDLCVTGQRAFAIPEIVCETLYVDPFVVTASANHRLAGRKRVTLEQLANEQWAFGSGPPSRQGQALRGAFESKRLPPPKVTLVTASFDVRAAAIAYSDMLGLYTRNAVSQFARHYPLVALPVPELSIVREVSVYYRKGAYLSPAALRLVELLKVQAQALAGERGASLARPSIRLPRGNAHRSSNR